MDVDWSDREARRALVGQLVSDARVALALASRALRGFSKDAARTRDLREARALLADLLVQDIEEDPDDGDGPEIRRGTARDRIISTTDPEMRHGHKSRSKGFDGYKASVVAETESGVILATDVRQGNVSDGEGAAELVEKAADRAGQKLTRVLGDTAYGNSQTRSRIESVGAELVAKVPPGTRKGMFSLADYRIDKKRGIAHCPAGKRSKHRYRIRGEDPGWRYAFSRTDCGACLQRKCCTKSKQAARTIQITAKTEELQVHRRRQKTKSFRKKYRDRVVVEHRIARLIQLGVRQARYLGSRSVDFQVAMAAAVANLGLLLRLDPILGLIWAAVTLYGGFFASLSGGGTLHSQNRTPVQPHNFTLQMALSRPGF